ncbi:MAG: ribosome-associated translation inhibitor RaiA [Pseudomonadota bacterium]
MRYQISGKHIDIGDALQTHVKSELAAAVEKYAERPTEAQVTFSKDAHEFVCESSVHLSTGLTVNAKARSADIYSSFDGCAERMEKQLRRYKRRLKDHHNQRTTPVEVFGASAYTLAHDDEIDDASEPETLQPIIVAETQTKIKSLSVGEAVMQMELAGENVLVFRNDGAKRVNVVYKRADGNIGWIDPE